MKYLKIYEKYEDDDNLYKLHSFFKYFSKKISNLNNWKFNLDEFNTYEFSKGKIIVEASPFKVHDDDIYVSIYNGDDVIYETKILKGMPQNNKEIEKFFNWYFEELMPELLNLCENFEKMVEFIKLAVDKKHTLHGLEVEIDGEFYTIDLESIYKRIPHSKKIQYTSGIDIENYDIYELAKIYNYLVKKYPELAVGKEWGFFELKESKDYYGNRKRIKKIYDYFWQHYKNVKYHNGWKFQIEGSQTYAWSKNNMVILITPFINEDFSTPITIYINDDEIYNWDQELDIPKTAEEREKFFNWYFNKYAPMILDLVEKGEKAKEFIKLLIENKGNEQGILDIKSEVDVDYIDFLSLERIINRNSVDETVVICFKDNKGSIHREELDGYDLYKLEKLYDYLVKKYPEISVGKEWGFFELKESKEYDKHIVKKITDYFLQHYKNVKHYELKENVIVKDSYYREKVLDYFRKHTNGFFSNIKYKDWKLSNFDWRKKTDSGSIVVYIQPFQSPIKGSRYANSMFMRVWRGNNRIEFTEKIELPKTPQERKEFYDWYFNSFAPRFLDKVDKSEETKEFIKLLIKNKGNGKRLEIKDKVGNDYIKYITANGIYFDQVRDPSSRYMINIDECDFQKLEKIHNYLAQKYPSVAVGKEWDFFGLKN